MTGLVTFQRQMIAGGGRPGSSASVFPELRAPLGGLDRIGAVTSSELLRRVEARCARHRNVPGICRECVLTEMEEMLVEENPGMKRGDAFELVQEWLRTADEPVQ